VKLELNLFLRLALEGFKSLVYVLVKGFLAGEDVDCIIGSHQHVDELAVSIFKVEDT
jgi:hypothetical protein